MYTTLYLKILMLYMQHAIFATDVLTGLHRLPVTNLIQPQSELRLIRKLDTTFVNNLKKRILEDPSGPGVPPVAVLCIGVDKDSFSERYKDSYRYEVLGGQHTVLQQQKQNCLEKILEIPFTIR